ncbi:MAG: AraC family transcriptional regulator [Gammaproteobacteria bacterium]|jgi:AraC-like DNA-binding protein|nr:AraC family transcriptional regulator [Gammaproteobacteria bacterium]MDX2461377.1 AraC family transcriptional regulator [Gammaproteobacteria bacterium]
MPYTNLASSSLSVWRALESYGVDPAPLFEQAGLDPQKLYDPNARYLDSRLYKLWRSAAETTKDPYIGLRVASFWHPSAAHALGYSWLASATLKDALQRTVRYFRMISDKERLSFTESDEEFRLVIENPIADYPTAFEDLDASFAALVNLCRLCYGESFNPRRITMGRPALPDPEPFAEQFRAPIQYSGNENSVCFDKAVAEAALPTANAEVARANEQIVQEYLARFDRSSVAMQVRARLTEQLSSGHANQESVANALHMSLRSLQRRLNDEGTSYKDLLDETRRELASHYMAESHRSINEITYLLGFSEPSNFSRAFRRWTGCSPSAYREHPPGFAT